MTKPDRQAAGATEVFVHERASATRSAPLVADAGVDRSVGPLEVSMGSLQSWFAAVVMDPRDIEESVGAHGLIVGRDDLDRVITAGPRLTSLQRLATYHYGYRARLVECLADDYPALRYAVGDDAFDALSHRYIEHHPSRSPSLNFFGRHMKAFLEGATAATLPEGVVEHRAFLTDLATLEWSLVEVLHAPLAPTLSFEEIAKIPPARWARARLPPADSARLLHLGYPANAYFQSWRTGSSPEIPAPSWSATAIYRQDVTLWRLDLTPPMARVLSALFEGAALGDALSRLETNADDAQAVADAERSVMAWFREWVQGGVFARVELDDPN